MQMKLLYYNCTFALFIFCLHKLGIEAHAYAHYTSLLCFALLYCGVSLKHDRTGRTKNDLSGAGDGRPDGKNMTGQTNILKA